MAEFTYLVTDGQKIVSDFYCYLSVELFTPAKWSLSVFFFVKLALDMRYSFQSGLTLAGQCSAKKSPFLFVKLSSWTKAISPIWATFSRPMFGQKVTFLFHKTFFKDIRHSFQSGLFFAGQCSAKILSLFLFVKPSSRTWGIHFNLG